MGEWERKRVEERRDKAGAENRKKIENGKREIYRENDL